MKSSITVIILISISTLSLGQINSTFKGDESEVWNTIQEWNDAFEANDVEKYFSFFHPDLSLFIPPSPYRIDGMEIDLKEFKWSLQNGYSTVSLFQELQPSVKVLGKTAIVTYHNRGVYGPKGQEQMVYLKETDILVKEEKVWKILHIHVSK